MSMLIDNDRYSNWYYGYTEIRLPFYFNKSLHFIVNSYSTNGIISNLYFNDTETNRGNVSYEIKVYPPAFAKYNQNVTLVFENLKNITSPSNCYFYESKDRMPGFNLTWYYSEITDEDDDRIIIGKENYYEEDSHYSENENTVAFVRHCLQLSHLFCSLILL